MLVQTREIDKVVVFAIEGGLLWEIEDDFLRKLTEIYEQGKCFIVVDLVECFYINSANMDILIQFKKKFQEKGGDLKFARANSLVNTIFENSNLPVAVDIFDSVETAVASYQAGKP